MSIEEENTEDAGQAETGSELRTRLERLPGVGSIRAAKLAKLGLVTVRDALMHFPRDYRDFTGKHCLDELVEGEHASLGGTVLSAFLRTISRGRTMLAVEVETEQGPMRCVWFNMPFLAPRFTVGRRFVVAGQPRRNGAKWEFSHPEVRWLDEAEDSSPVEWLAVYPLTEGVLQSHVRLAVQAALSTAADHLEESLPNSLLESKNLMSIGEAIRSIHCPESRDAMEAARRRFVYQELLMLQLALRLHRGQQDVRQTAPSIDIDSRLDSRIKALFSHDFTAAQKRVCVEIASDMRQTKPMNRLLQGDVGSGKTAVAAYCMLATAATSVLGAKSEEDSSSMSPSGRFQAAIMAPTELLARQHYHTLTSLLTERGSSLQVGLLVGGQRVAERRKLREQIESGEIQLVVGTQALICSEAAFANLGLVVIDEQHRFGVLQRALLRQGSRDPHTLVMTATPIPRTVAHAVYGDLDISVIDELPPGRQEVATYRVANDQAEQWWEFFCKKLKEGRQGYVVVPTVDISGRDMASISSAFESLANGHLEAFRLGLLHGRMKPDQKASVMADFRDRRFDVLVATSVIEVGIDVPNATLMTILDAENFGLAQLHQLRGRIARGRVQGICAAVTDAEASTSPRIDAFVSTADGFVLAEQDLILRGPGDILGSRQSGSPPLYLADLLRDGAVAAEARSDAKTIFETDPALDDPKFIRLKKVLLGRWAATLNLGLERVS
ncbi:MAG: ATP-dependent DNA helicase RecG [Planctomycetes bacterium]|nr:ATP-dependent DNA helicase RecG [Planctomycetota bacterium]MBL6909507.1 ATP-dependent DNA helicase RecG [Pirellulales bacterium]MBL7182596.1 ATP-dependent DNA helicase RecG [Pirellulales bacterium]